MKAGGLVLPWALAASVSAQMLPTRGTLVLGAGKAGSWDTSIAVMNVDPAPLSIEIGPNLDCNQFGGGCGLYTQTTIAPFATFTLPSIPEEPSFPGPQDVYVRSSALQKAPVVGAVVVDRGSACERSMTLPGLSLSEAFAPGDLVFAGVSRDAEQYANLIMTAFPPQGTPLFSETEVHVSVRDSAGVEVGAGTYRVVSGIDVSGGVVVGATVVVDFLRALGVVSLEGGSVLLSAQPLPFGDAAFAAVVTVVASTRASAIQGTRVPGQ